MSKSVPKKEFKGSDYWYSLSMQEKFDAYVIMNNDFEYRLWMLQEESALDATLFFHLLNIGYRFSDSLVSP